MSLNILNLFSKSEVATAAPSRRIVEMPMRVFHSLMALSFTGAYLTAEIERFRLLHVSLGYTLFGLVIFRLIWGFLGPRQSRLTGTWRKLTAIQNLRQLMNASMAATALLTLSIALLITASGYVFYSEMAGEWMGEIHEFFWELHARSGFSPPGSDWHFEGDATFSRHTADVVRPKSRCGT